LFDGFPIKSFNFPQGDYILSVVFDNLKNNNFQLKEGKYIIKLPERTIYFYKQDDKMMIDEYKNGKKVSSKWFR